MASKNTEILYGLGGRIRKTREECGMSLTDLALAVGSDKSALGKIERGERVPNVDTVGKLADEMRVSMAPWFQEEPSDNVSAMKQFMDEQQDRLDKLSPEQLSNLMGAIDQMLKMSGV